MVMLTSSNSKFDHYRRNEAGGTLTSDETAGYAVLKPNVLLVTLLI
jgi:cytochrome c peroxidase